MKYGCHVIWAVRNPEKAMDKLKEIEEKEGKLSGKATVLKVDLMDLTTVKPFVGAFLQLKLPLHYLILNAGIMAPLQWEPSAQNIESMFATNNLSHFLMSQLLMGKITETAKSDEVRIVILTSMAGVQCSNVEVSNVPVSKENYHEFGDYAVTKAVDGFHARGLQKKFPPGSNVSAVAAVPGIIETGLGGGNDSIVNLLYKSYTMAPFRKGLPSGAATTMYCALSPDVPAQVAKGYFLYYNRGPQSPGSCFNVFRRDDLIEPLEQKQLEMVRPYM